MNDMKNENMFNTLENVVFTFLTTDIAKTPIARCMKIFRDSLTMNGMSFSIADSITQKVQFKVSEDFFSYGDRSTKLVEDFGVAVVRMYNYFDNEYTVVDLEMFRQMSLEYN